MLFLDSLISLLCKDNNMMITYHISHQHGNRVQTFEAHGMLYSHFGLSNLGVCLT